MSEQAQATILAEGRPLHLTLSDKDADALAALLASGDTKAGAAPPTVSDTIAKTAEAYDYTAEKVSGHLYLLHKRYSDVRDLPCVPYEELLNAVRQMERLYDQYGSHTAAKGEYAPAELLYQSLTPAQVLKSETGIAIGDLTVDQQQLARAAEEEVAEAEFGMRVVELQRFVHYTTALKSPKTVFLYEIPVHTNVQAFVCRGPFDYNDAIYGSPMNNRFLAYSLGYSRETRNVATMPKTEAEENAAWGPDKTMPTDVDRLALREAQADKSPYRTTLGALAQTITDAKSVTAASSATPAALDLPADVKTPVRFTVDAGLGSKGVSAYGLKYSASDAIIRALASLYQLTLFVPKPRQYQIVLATFSDRADEEPGVKIAKLIPAPLQRSRDRQAVLAGDAAVKNDKDSLPPEFLRQGARIDSAHAYYYSADHRLLLLAMPLVPTPDSPPVPLSQADPEVYRIIALMVYVSSCQYIVEDMVNIPPPFYLAHLDALVIRMGYTRYTKGGGGLKVTFGYRDEAGEYHAERAHIYSHTTPYPAPTTN